MRRGEGRGGSSELYCCRGREATLQQRLGRTGLPNFCSVQRGIRRAAGRIEPAVPAGSICCSDCCCHLHL
ncbi:hypothetical protein NDU88_005714 [Pleurodeles waltl]|uniref:Uncharacterized protein n=1 Tax=Pleurodeles waltl TaxID=8319 RepID=A0AAV7QJU3_PLEWA|nr:hypothetical protein NDU88_005714 [Pleurodeles waltl]